MIYENSTSIEELDRRLGRRNAVEKLLECSKHLGKEDRAMLRFRSECGMTFPEIGDKLGIIGDTARKRYIRLVARTFLPEFRLMTDYLPYVDEKHVEVGLAYFVAGKPMAEVVKQTGEPLHIVREKIASIRSVAAFLLKILRKTR